MELKDYATEELKAELKRRAAKKREALAKVPRCRNCKHIFIETRGGWFVNYKCDARTFIMYKDKHHYIVSPSKRACEHYERKEK